MKLFDLIADCSFFFPSQNWCVYSNVLTDFLIYQLKMQRDIFFKDYSLQEDFWT